MYKTTKFLINLLPVSSWRRQLRKKFLPSKERPLLNISDNGEGNIIDVATEKNSGFISVFGNFNKVRIDTPEEFSKFHIIIYGSFCDIEIKKVKLLRGLSVLNGCPSSPADNTRFVVGKRVSMEDNVTVMLNNSECQCLIGDDCLFSNNITIRTGERPHLIFDAVTGENIDGPHKVVIGNHCWIGENSFIMKRAHLSNDVIVGSASVVTKAFDEEQVLIAGNPAKICKRGIVWAKNINKL